MINLFSKTDDFMKMINLFSKTDDFIKIINLFSKTGLGRSGHDRSQSFGPIWHVSGPQMVFWRNDIMIRIIFAGEAQKSSYFDQKPKWLIKIIPKINKNR